MGLGEQAGKIASTTVDALKSTPIVLALVIFNVIFMLMTGYISLKVSQRSEHEIDRWESLVRSCQSLPAREPPQQH